MKKYKLFLLLTCLFIQKLVIAQNTKGITISFEKETLHTVLKALMKQTGMEYIAKTECLNLTPPITIKANNVPLTEILNTICKGSPITYYITENIIILAPKPVHGRVTDEMDEPLADVLVQAGDYTALTNSRGEFYLRYGACEKTIKFSHPGDTVILRSPGKTYVTVHMRNRTTITAN
jgi:hypothetical protein